MTHSPRLLFRALCCLLFAFGLVGCATPKYRLHGKITRAGKPLEWESENRKLLVLFNPVDIEDDKNVYRAETDTEAGTYVIAAIPAGTYRVSIQQQDPYPLQDLLGFAYSLKSSPIMREVKGNGEINIDLPAVTPPAVKKGPPKK
jgi:hypothetical protein